MTTREMILADSTSLLKDDPGVAEAICDPAPPGSRTAKKITAMAAVITRLTPSIKSPPVDPCGSLQRSLSSVLYGVGGKGPSLSLVVDLTNRHCPMTRTFHLLRKILASVADIAEMREGAFSGWSQEQAEALGECLPQAGRGLVYVGYRVNAARLRNALDELACVERDLLSTDPRRSLVHAVFRLVSSILRQLREELDWAGDKWLELMAEEGTPGRFVIRTIEPPSETDNPTASISQADVRPALARLLAWVSLKIEARRAARLAEMSHVEIVGLVRAEAQHLYRAATKVDGVGDVHLAIKALSERCASSPCPQVSEDQPEREPGDHNQQLEESARGAA